MIFEEKIEITKDLCEESGRMKLSALAMTLQDVADHQLTPLKIRGYDIMEEGYMWVIIRRYMELKRFPRLGDVLTFYTWTAPGRHGFCPRRFRAQLQDGTVVLNVVCQWVVSDTGTRTMVTPLPDFVEKLEPDKMPDELKMPKMPKEWPELTSTVKKEAVAEDIDANGHVNNSRYMAWAMQIWENFSEKGKTTDPSKIMIEYTHEVMKGEVLDLNFTFEGDKLYLKGCHGSDTNFSIIMA